jgi:hypothetical protein
LERAARVVQGKEIDVLSQGRSWIGAGNDFKDLELQTGAVLDWERRRDA